MAIFGLCIYWWKHRAVEVLWRRRLALSILGLTVSISILLITLISKFTYGGWVTVLITGAVIAMCLLIRKHYLKTDHQLKELRNLLLPLKDLPDQPMIPLDPLQPTAAFMVGKNPGVAMHTLLWAQRMFPGHFKNFIFITAGIVDVQSFGGQDTLDKMKKEVGITLNYLVEYCRQHDQAATSYCRYGTDPVTLLERLAERVNAKFPNTVFFASKLIFAHDRWWTRLLHNEAAFAVQTRLHLKGMQLVILPIKIE